jgi:hypothetical protein
MEYLWYVVTGVVCLIVGAGGMAWWKNRAAVKALVQSSEQAIAQAAQALGKKL